MNDEVQKAKDLLKRSPVQVDVTTDPMRPDHFVVNVVYYIAELRIVVPEVASIRDPWLADFLKEAPGLLERLLDRITVLESEIRSLRDTVKHSNVSSVILCKRCGGLGHLPMAPRQREAGFAQSCPDCKGKGYLPVVDAPK